MDNTIGHDIVLRWHRQAKLRVDFSQRYNRKRHADEQLESTIDATWAVRRVNNPSLFNGTKFRFCGLQLDAQICTIRLGVTDYKTYLGTHSSADAVAKWGMECMGQPLGNVVIPETRDGKTALLVRSVEAGEGVGAIVFPGGHPEPDMVHNLQENDSRVEKELWEGARREVLEELWVGDHEVGKVEEMQLLGMVGRKSDGKVSMVFTVKVGLTGEQMVQRFEEKNDGVESDKLLLMELDSVAKVTENTLDGRTVAMETSGAATLWLDRALDHRAGKGDMIAIYSFL